MLIYLLLRTGPFTSRPKVLNVFTRNQPFHFIKVRGYML